MDINELTLGEAKSIARALGLIAEDGADAAENSGTDGGRFRNLVANVEWPAVSEYLAFTPHIGMPCIVRTYASGVFFGTLVKQDNRQIELKGARRLWSWKAASGISLSAVAVNGVDTKASRITAAVPSQTILDALEILPAEKACIVSIAATPAAEAS